MTPPAIPASLVEQVARAYDAEDAAQRGEPSPWDIGREDDGYIEWTNERLACAEMAIRAALSSGLVILVDEGLRGLMAQATDYAEAYAHPSWDDGRTDLERAAVHFARSREGG